MMAYEDTKPFMFKLLLQKFKYCRIRTNAKLSKTSFANIYIS